jgi:hypothetical protein
VKLVDSESGYQAIIDYVYGLPPEERIMGLDSEYEGVVHNAKEIDDDCYWKTSVVRNGEIVVFSVGFLSGDLHPRGYEKAKGAVLHRRALEYSPFRRLLEDPGVLKPSHNSNVECHAFYNKGIDLLGIINTLSLARWMLPGELAYNLDSLSTKYLGEGKTESFDDLMYIPNMIVVAKEKKVKVCDCGVVGCRKRKGHVKTEVIEIEEVDKQAGWIRLNQFDIADNPSHSLHQRYLAYARRDATLAVSLYDFLLRINTKTEVPWYAHSE